MNIIDNLRDKYLRGIGVIIPGLLNCFLTCVGGAFANVAFEQWTQGAWALLTRRIAVGYLGAVVIVVLVLPWIHQIWIGRRQSDGQGQ